MIRKCRASLLVFFFITSCSTDIRKIREYQDEYLDQEVRIEGDVDMVIPLTTYYKIKDKSGEIYVQAKSHLPESGSRYKVRGILRKKEVSLLKSFLASGVYIEETSRSLQ
jgi:hypothetical protein